MCFSATASFGASVLLLGIGITAERKSRNFQQQLFSSIPLVFATQQFAEGVLWTGMQHAQYDTLVVPAMYMFMIFAQVVWPILIPLSILLLEKERRKKKIITGFLISGIVAAAYMLYCIVFRKLTVNIECYHINYRQDIPDLPMRYGGIFYLAPVIISPFFSSIKKIRSFGVVIVLSYAIAEIFYQEYLTSVWCFFAAIISFIVLIVIRDLNKKELPTGYVSE